jgi:HEAT repeat protein
MTRRIISLTALLLAGMIVAAAPRGEEAKKYAEDLKSSKSPKTRLTAAKELGRLGQVQRKVTEPYTDVIVTALKDSDPKVRGEAARTLGLIDPTDKKDAIDKLIAILKSEKSEEAREGQEMGLGSLGGTTDDTELKTKARQALLEQRKKTESKREQKVIQAAILLITGPKKKN